MKLLPTAALFLAVILGGLIGSAIARRVARWAIEKTGLDALAEKAGAARLLYAVGIRKGVSHAVGSLVYAAGVLVTAAAAADVLGLTAVDRSPEGLLGRGVTGCTEHAADLGGRRDCRWGQSGEQDRRRLPLRESGREGESNGPASP